MPGLSPPSRQAARLALVVSLASNAVPLVGVALWGWSLFEVLLTYWAESGVIGLFTVPRVLLARHEDPAWKDARTGEPVRYTLGSRLGLVLIFGVTYGAFWIAHGLLVLAFFGGEGGGVPGFGVALVALLLGHTAAFLDFAGREGYRTATPMGEAWTPIGRVFVLQAAALGGGLLIERFGSPVGAVTLLVVLKLGADLVLAALARVWRAAPVAN